MFAPGAARAALTHKHLFARAESSSRSVCRLGLDAIFTNPPSHFPFRPESSPTTVMTKSFHSVFTAGALAASALASSLSAAETVKVGVLHSLSGTMAISETSLRDVLLFTFDEINAKGGVLGKKSSRSSSMAPRTGRSSPRRRSSCSSRIKLP